MRIPCSSRLNDDKTERHPMKTGFSLLLQEYVNPVELDYEDCRTFQIVCPACKEPVFKVSRATAGNKADYLSHYRKDETLNEQCELRVRHILFEKCALGPFQRAPAACHRFGLGLGLLYTNGV